MKLKVKPKSKKDQLKKLRKAPNDFEILCPREIEISEVCFDNY